MSFLFHISFQPGVDLLLSGPISAYLISCICLQRIINTIKGDRTFCFIKDSGNRSVSSLMPDIDQHSYCSCLCDPQFSDLLLVFSDLLIHKLILAGFPRIRSKNLLDNFRSSRFFEILYVDQFLFTTSFHT